jgi:hypothetical protein
MNNNPFDPKPKSAEEVQIPERVKIEPSDLLQIRKESTHVPTKVNIDIINAHVNSGGSIQLVPRGSKGIIIKKEFNAELQKNIDALEIELQGIKDIKSQADAQTANATLKKAKTLLKGLEAERKLMTSVLDDEKSDTMRYEKTISDNLQALVLAVNNGLTIFQREEDRKAREAQELIERQKREALKKAQDEANRIGRIKTMINEFERNVLNRIHSSTIDDIDANIAKLASVKLTAETYAEFLPDAQIMYQSCVTKFNERKVELMRLAEAEKKNFEAAQNQRLELEQKQKREMDQQNEKAEMAKRETNDKLMEDVSNIQMETELKNAMVPQAKGVQKPWVFDEENIDLSLLPLEFHTFDKKKIKEAIGLGARDIPGVKIYQEIRNVSR